MEKSGDLSSSSARTAVLVFTLKKRGGGAFVFAIGELPENAADGVGIVAERKRAGGHAAGAALAMGVVQRWGADAHGDVSLAALQRGVGEQAAVGADEDDDVLVVDGVAEKVGRRVCFRQSGGGAGEFGLHDLKIGSPRRLPGATLVTRFVGWRPEGTGATKTVQGQVQQAARARIR